MACDLQVRNPLSAAISAVNFVSAAVHEQQPLITEESRRAVKEDIQIIDASLNFINDLLRNMLDMHRAADKELHLQMVPVSVYSDIMEPVAAMLYNRGENFEIRVDCSEDLAVISDKLRLKQIVLNLARNSTCASMDMQTGRRDLFKCHVLHLTLSCLLRTAGVKFVEKGFVRLRGEVINNSVVLSVEDSGPGIPEEKREQLFNKFQRSLDRLSQGTGVGLAVVRKLIDLMKGDIHLDGTYDCGVDGFRGTRFVINLNTPPIALTVPEEDVGPEGHQIGKRPPAIATSCNMNAESAEEPALLPENLSIMFVDDDMILRRLFVRSVRKFYPEWEIREAASGEAALRIVEENNTIDLIFVDQFMASVEQNLLGTETVRAMRSRGVRSRICGLSANDMEKAFLEAGANMFWIKPFPCKKDELAKMFAQFLATQPIGSEDFLEDETEHETLEI